MHVLAESEKVQCMCCFDGQFVCPHRATQEDFLCDMCRTNNHACNECFDQGIKVPRVYIPGYRQTGLSGQTD